MTTHPTRAEIVARLKFVERTAEEAARHEKRPSNVWALPDAEARRSLEIACERYRGACAIASGLRVDLEDGTGPLEPRSPRHGPDDSPEPHFWLGANDGTPSDNEIRGEIAARSDA